MELSQVKRWLGQPVAYQLPTGEWHRYRFTGCTIVKDEKHGEYRYLAELLDETNGRSVMQVNLENIQAAGQTATCSKMEQVEKAKRE